MLSMQPLPEMNQSCNLLVLRIVASAEDIDKMSINKCEAISSRLGNGPETDTKRYTHMQHGLAEPSRSNLPRHREFRLDCLYCLVMNAHMHSLACKKT